MENIRNIIPANVKTELDKMNLLDRFLFNETVEDPEVYKAMVEILLEGHVSSIQWTETEKELRILVAPFDIFGYGLYRYTFEEYSQEVPELRLNDGSRRIFINTKGNNSENFSQEFLDFMDYINQTTDLVAERSKSNRIRKINDRVRSVKDSEKVGVKLMQAWEERYYDRLEAREEGHAEGMREGMRNLIQKKLAKGKSIEEIADILEEPIEVIKELVEELASNEN